MAAVSVKIYDMFWSEMVSGLGELGGKPYQEFPAVPPPPPGVPPLGKNWGERLSP